MGSHSKIDHVLIDNVQTSNGAVSETDHCVVAFEKMNRYMSPGIDQIQAELIQAGGNTEYSKVHKLINLIWNKEELPQQ
jgi:hypothetical protein